MSQSRQQLRLVFSSQTPTKKPCKMSLTSRRKPLLRRNSGLAEKLRHLERISPDRALVVERIVDGFLVQILGAPLE